MNELVERVVGLVEHELSLENIVIHKQLGDGLPEISGESQLIQQVIFDLIDNAKWAIQQKSGREGGTISIKTEYNPDSKSVLLSICDTGIGIAQEDLERIFEPFFTTKEVGKGTGLGLSIVHSIIKEHKADIQTESEPGKGATFKIRFPAA